MSVLEIHSQTFVGVRARRTIDEVVHEKRFSYFVGSGANRRRVTLQEKRELLAKAEAEDKRLEVLQKKAANRRRGAALPAARSNTAVRGISLNNLYERNAAGALIKLPAFIVGCRDFNGNPVKKGYLIHRHGYNEAWQMATRLYVKVKRIRGRAATDILERRPPPLRPGVASKKTARH